jgi:hypothetical protein
MKIVYPISSFQGWKNMTGGQKEGKIGRKPSTEVKNRML